MRLINSYSTIVFGSICFLLAVVFAQDGLPQTTNRIPSDVFLTDNGFLFWYNQSGERLVKLKDIEKAKQIAECLPAEQDPEGHWGQVANGFQLSLRFEKAVFTNGEPILATMFMRNVSNATQSYFRPIRVVSSKNGNIQKNKYDTGLFDQSLTPVTTLFPQTQNKYRDKLNQSYDLSESGQYVFKAVCTHPSVTSQPVVVTITNSIP